MGAWARGIDFKNTSNTTIIGGVGVYGVDTTASKVYIGLGSTPWSGCLEITKDELKFNNKSISYSDHDHDNTYLKSSGGTLTGNLRYSGAGWTGDFIRFTPDLYGAAISMGGGGSFILGAGESYTVLQPNINNTETLHLASDHIISFYSNLNAGWAERKTAEFRTDGEMYINNSKVYHESNKPTPDAIGAINKKYNGNNFRVYKDLVGVSSNLASVIGTMRIKLPKSWSSTMMVLNVKIYDYSIRGFNEFKLGGYNAAGSTNSWTRCSATIEGDPVTTDVRFSHDDTSCCILIGNTTTEWRYPKVFVNELVCGFGSALEDWENGWSIDFLSSETVIDSTKSLTVTNNAHRSHGHNFFHNGYEGLTTNDNYYASYIRTTVNGLIPFSADSTNGVSMLGTASWKFKGVWSAKYNDYTMGVESNNVMNSILATNASGHVNTGVQMNFHVGNNMPSKVKYLRLQDGQGFQMNDVLYATDFKILGSNLIVPTLSWGNDSSNFPNANDNNPLGSMFSKFGEDSEMWIKTGNNSYQKLGLASKAEVKNREIKDKLTKRKIIGELPFKFPGYDEVLAKHGGTHLYPQGFDIDINNNEIIVGYNTAGTLKLRARTLVIYSLSTLLYKGYVECVDCGGESVIVRTENNIRYVYLKYGFYDIAKHTFPVKSVYKETLTKVSNVNVGCDLEFTERDGNWLVEQTGATNGMTKSRKLFHLFDSNFNKTSSIIINSSLSGNFSDYSKTQPKRQGIAMFKGHIYQVSGGYWDATTPSSPYGFTGISVLDFKGDLLDNQLCCPLEFKNILERNNIPCKRIENEGMSITEDGDVYTLYITKTYKDAGIESNGVVLFREMTDEKGYVDFKEASKPYTMFNSQDFEGLFPRSGDGKMYNPCDGTLMDTIEKIYNFMKATDFKTFGFYSSSVEITDVNNNVVPESTIVKIYNGNNAAMYMDYINFDYKQTYFLYESNNVLKMKQLSGFYPSEITLASGVTSFYANAKPRISRVDNTVTLSGLVSGVGTARPFKIGTIPENMRPKDNMPCIVPLSASTSGGYGVITAMANGDLLVNFLSSNVNFVSLNGVSYHI